MLIAAPGAENTRVANSTGLKTDWRGYTVVPYATSYRENRIALDAASLKRNVDLENAVVNVVPTKGALVLAEFNAHAGARVLMKTSKQGIPLRFGAIATLDGIQTNSGIIDDDGSLYMSGLPAQGAITVRWAKLPIKFVISVTSLPNNKLTLRLREWMPYADNLWRKMRVITTTIFCRRLNAMVRSNCCL